MARKCCNWYFFGFDMHSAYSTRYISGLFNMILLKYGLFKVVVDPEVVDLGVCGAVRVLGRR